jgi:hypothetical protein
MIPDNATVTFTQQFNQSIQHFDIANDIQYGNQTDKNQVQPPRIDKTLASLKNTKKIFPDFCQMQTLKKKKWKNKSNKPKKKLSGLLGMGVQARIFEYVLCFWYFFCCV